MSSNHQSYAHTHTYPPDPSKQTHQQNNFYVLSDAYPPINQLLERDLTIRVGHRDNAVHQLEETRQQWLKNQMYVFLMLTLFY
jgi:hypothetical protein